MGKGRKRSGPRQDSLACTSTRLRVYPAFSGQFRAPKNKNNMSCVFSLPSPVAEYASTSEPPILLVLDWFSRRTKTTIELFDECFPQCNFRAPQNKILPNEPILDFTRHIMYQRLTKNQRRRTRKNEPICQRLVTYLLCFAPAILRPFSRHKCRCKSMLYIMTGAFSVLFPVDGGTDRPLSFFP